ncbi:hypothetical protein Tco_0107484, partial [Tanacetum coccineum]
VPQFNLKLLDLAPWAILIGHHLLQSFLSHCICNIITDNPNVGVPPRQGISLKSTSSKLDLTCDCAFTYMENRFNLFEPLSKTNNSFSALEIQGLTFEEISVGALTSNRHSPSSVTP